MEKVNTTIKIENRKAESKRLGPEMNYFEFIRYAIDARTQDGISIGEVRNRIKILDKIDPPTHLGVEKTTEIKKGKEYAEFTFEEFKMIRKLFLELKWQIVDKAILDFEDYLSELSKQIPAEPAAK